MTAYLTEKGHAPYAQGQRYGADGDGRLPVRNRADAIDQMSRRWRGDRRNDFRTGYSIYLTDPEGTVVELKSGN